MRRALCLGIACLWPLLPLQAQERDLVIGLTGSQLSGLGPDSYAIFSRYLEEQLPGYRFEVRPYDAIAQLMEAAQQDALDFAMVSPAAHVELLQQHDLRILATVTQIVDGQVYPWQPSAVFVRDEPGAPIDLRDATQRRVMGLARLSIGGWLAAEREWRQLGIDPEKDFTSVDFRFSYEQVVDAVCAGDADVGVLSATVFANLRARCATPLRVLTHPQLPPDPRLAIPHSSRLYPELAFVALGKQLPEALVVSMTRALLSIQSGSAVANAVSVGGFTAPLNYSQVEQLMQELRIGPFAEFGQFGFIDFLRQHSGKVSAVLMLVLGLLALAFVRSQQLNRRLAQAEQFRRLLFEQSTLPVAILDRDSFRFVEVNQAAVRVYGFQRAEDVIGKTPLDVSAPRQKDGRDSAPLVREVATRHALPGGGSFEWLHQRPDGSQWEADVHLLSFDFGRQHLLQATMVDVTERNRIREERARITQQLNHAQRLESLGRLSGAIAHDFNNLLTVINGYSELLLLGMDKQSRDYRTVLEIAQAGWRARDLTNQLLAFGRRQIGSLRPMDVNAMIVEAGNMYRGLLGEKVKLQTDLDTRPCVVLADAGQLNQVLMNMLANARDAMPEGGSCYISTTRRDVGTDEAEALGIAAGPCLVLSVTDTGHGMDARTRERVFEPFFSTKGEKGSGIGLATAYGIIRQWSGVISFLSEPGLGTTFSIHLPLTSQQSTDEVESQPEVADLNASAPHTVLVVDDQPDVRLYACSVLRSAGYRVLEADSGERALELLRSRHGRVELLFTDVVMPGMNGRELAERCASEWPATRILFTSGYADDEVALHGVTLDQMQFIAKPYVPQHLLSKVKSCLAGPRPG